MNPNEIWKLVQEEGKLKVKGKYYISNKGNFYSTFSNKVLKPQKCHKGYLYVEIGRRKYKVHRLVAKYFIPNPNNLPQVNHIDCNKENNCVENLEWCTNHYNYEYSLKMGTFSKEFLEYKGNYKKIRTRHNEKKLQK
jgi:hypothetical protein